MRVPPVIREACIRAGLRLDTVGIGSGNPLANPEHVLPRYDIVFAKAKAAMEAMAVGNAVVLCDFAGVGPMVSPENFAQLLPMNFGFQALTQPLTPDNVKSMSVDNVSAAPFPAFAGTATALEDVAPTYLGRAAIVDEFAMARERAGH